MDDIFRHFSEMSSRSSGENEIAAAIWGRDRSNWGGGVVLDSFLLRGGFLRYELFSQRKFRRNFRVTATN